MAKRRRSAGGETEGMRKASSPEGGGREPAVEPTRVVGSGAESEPLTTTPGPARKLWGQVSRTDAETIHALIGALLPYASAADDREYLHTDWHFDRPEYHSDYTLSHTDKPKTGHVDSPRVHYDSGAPAGGGGGVPPGGHGDRNAGHLDYTREHGDKPEGGHGDSPKYHGDSGTKPIHGDSHSDWESGHLDEGFTGNPT